MKNNKDLNKKSTKSQTDAAKRADIDKTATKKTHEPQKENKKINRS